jgi:plastocyanin
VRRAQLPVLGALLVLTGGALAACGDAPPKPGGSGPAKTTLSIHSFEFRPAQISVEAGAEVVWVNEDDILHTVTSGIAGEQGVPGVSEDLPPAPDGAFDLELDGRKSTAAFTFAEAGTYPYFCAVHSGMSGIVQVA